MCDRRLLAALVIAGAADAVCAQATFQVIKEQSEIHGISADGAGAAGASYDGEGVLHAFRWTRAGGTETLFDPGVESQARGAARAGDVVAGWLGESAVRVSNGGFLYLGRLPGSGESYAYGVSADGDTVVGECLFAYYYCDKFNCYFVEYFQGQAFRWTAQSGMEDLGYLPGADPNNYAFARAEAVSAQGDVVVGWSSSTEGIQAFRWAGSMIGLGDLPGNGFYSEARAVNADGSVVVGSSSTDAGRRAFRWVLGQGMASIGVLPGVGAYSDAFAVSSDGRIVAGGSSGDAFIWTPGSEMRDVRELLIARGAAIPASTRLRAVEAMSADGRALAGTALVDSQPHGFVAYLENTHRATLSQTEAPANGHSGGGSISGSGQLIAFSSDATNLVPGDTNARTDIFVRNRAAGWTARESVSSAGVQGNGVSTAARITPDGRYVVFTSAASNLVAGDTNNAKDIFVRDRAAKTTVRVSVSSNGGQANGASDQAQITPDGRYIVFQSLASNLVAGDTNGVSDIFLRDRQTGQTTRLSVSTGGQQGNGASVGPGISNTGLAVVFTSEATNLTPGDTNNRRDVFLRNRSNGQTTIITNNYKGKPADGDSYGARISGNGRYVALTTEALWLTYPGGKGIYVWDRQTAAMTRAVVGDEHLLSAISGDGRFLLFSSTSSTVVGTDTNQVSDAFVRDVVVGETWRVSLGRACEQTTADAFGGSLSPDGKWATFTTEAPGLDPDDTDAFNDVLVRELFVP
jgi:probable HAF family extracellular repeat protein